MRFFCTLLKSFILFDFLILYFGVFAGLFLLLLPTLLVHMLLPALASDVQATSSLSREDGISGELEHALRIRGAGLIQRAGILCGM